MTISERTLSPRQAAQALGASESSLKRWIDAGELEARRSAGGHRRLPVAEVLRFAQREGLQVRNGDLLGLPPVQAGRSLRRDVQVALMAGDEAALRRHLLTAHLDGIGVAALADGPIRAAMAMIGRRWLKGPGGIADEHRATLIAARAIDALRDALPQPAPDAPLALGGAPAGDPYLLPTMLTGLVLQEAGWRTIDLGPDCPDAAVLAATGRYQANLVWRTYSSTPDTRSGPALRHLASALDGIPLVVGGRTSHALGSALRVSSITHVGDMAGLFAHAVAIRSGT
jgi:MerR family transcriptional regulator, light-induced transcriptional regulator